MFDDASKGLSGPPISASQGDGFDRGEAAFERAKSVTVEAAQNIAREFGNLERAERLRLAKAFRAELIPRRAPGRKRRKEITAAYADWKSGLRKLAFYRKHIPRFDQLSEWRRQAKIRALRDAVRSRERREKIRIDDTPDRETV